MKVTIQAVFPGGEEARLAASALAAALVVSDRMPLPIPVDCFVFHTIPFAFTLALMCLAMVNAINPCMTAAVVTAPVPMRHNRHSKTT